MGESHLLPNPSPIKGEGLKSAEVRYGTKKSPCEFAEARRQNTEARGGMSELSLMELKRKRVGATPCFDEHRGASEAANE